MTAGFDGVATQRCLWCGATVPSARFCGSCGAHLDGNARLPWLRPREYAVAPSESVFLPMITSSLFPHLAQPTRNPFRIAMFIMLIGLVCCSLLRVLGPAVTLAALGVPLLFVVYLWQTGIYRGMPRHLLAIAAALGAALGAGWVVLTGGLIARSYGLPMAVGFGLERILSVGLAISVFGAFLMVLPAVILRLTKPRLGESLDGFVVGALGALSFTGAATITRLAPQFVAGLISGVRPVRLLVEAVLYGVASPLTAAAVGGLIGIVLWFRPGEWAGGHRARVRAFLMFFAAQLVLIYTGLWLIDSTRLAEVPQLVLHILMTVLALIVLRVSIQLALLHERPDPYTGLPLLCMHCEKVVPDMPFCPACGVSARASSRESRRQVRDAPPIRDEQSDSHSGGPV